MRRVLHFVMALAFLIGSIPQIAATGKAEGAAGGRAVEQKPAKLTYWVGLPSTVASAMKSFDENITWQEMQRIFDVDIVFVHPPVGQETEQFNLMVASGSYPDLVESNWSTFPGGPEKAINDKIIVELTDLIARNAPALTAYMKERPDIAKQFITDTKKFYVFPSLNKSPINTTAGFMVRDDWLKELGVPSPKTVADVEALLEAFRAKKGASAPYTMENGWFDSDSTLGMFGVGSGFFIEGGKVLFAPMLPQYREYIVTMARWYGKKLLDPDFAANVQKDVVAKLLGGKSGYAFGAVAGVLGTVLDSAKKAGTSVSLAGVDTPVANAGDPVKFSARAWEYRGSGSVAITTGNKYPAFSAAFMDYLYSDKGHVLKNFGVEGKTFNMVNGKPAYGDFIMKNPDGLTYRQAMGKYIYCDSPHPGFIDGAFHLSTFTNPSQQPAALLWGSHDAEVVKFKLPQLTPTPEEASEMARIMITVNTFKAEMVTKMVMGQIPLSDYDKFVAELKKMNIDRAIAINQAAYNRFLGR